MSGESFVDHYRKIVVFWSPKCACTAVARWFSHGVLESNPTFSKKLPYGSRQWLNRKGYSYRYVQARLLVEEFNYFSVYFCRHPATRFVSAFLDKFVVHNGQKLCSFHQLEPFAKALVRRIYEAQKRSVDDFNGIRFSDFLCYVENKILGSSNFVPLNHHWDTQLPRNVSNHFNVDFLVHQESFADDIRKLNEKLHIDYVPKKENATTFHDAQVSEEYLIDLYSVDMAKSNLKLGERNFLSSDVIKRLKQIYVIDYAYFGYD